MPLPPTDQSRASPADKKLMVQLLLRDCPEMNVLPLELRAGSTGKPPELTLSDDEWLKGRWLIELQRAEAQLAQKMFRKVCDEIARRCERTYFSRPSY